jgi:MSHA pilin protein MshA
MNRSNKQQGFTLIELVVVIVILGILAATAAPKFIDLTSDAKQANRTALLGAIKSAMEMANMKCIVDSDCSLSGASTITVGGNSIRMNGGYPIAHHRFGIGLLVEVGEWDMYTTSNVVAFAYPNTGNPWSESDCVIAYVTGGNPKPIFTTAHNKDTCS